MKSNFLSSIFIFIFAISGCKKNDNGTNAYEQEDWTYPASTTSDSVTVYCEKQDVAFGEEFDVKLVLYNVTDVFGVAFEMDYPADKCEISSVLVGPFFPSDNIIALPPVIEPDSNRVSCGLTKVRGSTSISGSGVVIKLKCVGKGSGKAAFTINPTNLAITKPDGTLIVRPIANFIVAIN